MLKLILLLYFPYLLCILEARVSENKNPILNDIQSVQENIQKLHKALLYSPLKQHENNTAIKERHKEALDYGSALLNQADKILSDIQAKEFSPDSAHPINSSKFNEDQLRVINNFFEEATNLLNELNEGYSSYQKLEKTVSVIDRTNKIEAIMSAFQHNVLTFEEVMKKLFKVIKNNFNKNFSLEKISPTIHSKPQYAAANLEGHRKPSNKRNPSEVQLDNSQLKKRRIEYQPVLNLPNRDLEIDIEE